MKKKKDYNVCIPMFTGEELTTTPYKLDPKDVTTIKVLAERNGHTIGQFVAHAINNEINNEKKKSKTGKKK